MLNSFFMNGKEAEERLKGVPRVKTRGIFFVRRDKFDSLMRFYGIIGGKIFPPRPSARRQAGGWHD